MSKLTANKIIEELKAGNLNIEPFNLNQLNPNSYNVKLSNTLKMYDEYELDAKLPNPSHELIIPPEGLVLQPNILYIGCTQEIISSDKYISAIDGRSSIGRLGISIHATAGFGDIGFTGTYTLEIFVIQPVRIYPDLEIGQVYFEDACGKTDFLYRGRYQGQIQPTTSKLYLNNSELDKDYFYKEK